MHLTSKDFIDGESIPSKFTCDGEDAVPNLQWSDEPEGTKSFALTLIDPDAPNGPFIHWLVSDIPANVHEINGASPIGSLQVDNDFGNMDYGGPCPPDGEHRYYFTLYALKIRYMEGLTKENFIEKIESHALDKAELMGRYKRSQ